MAQFTIIDTDILIDIGRNVSVAISYLETLAQTTPLAISTVTQMELIVGCRNKAELKELVGFLDNFEILKLDETVSDIAVDLLNQYRLSHGLLIADALIAATAIGYDYPLTSKNQRDYRFITSLNLLSYP